MAASPTPPARSAFLLALVGAFIPVVAPLLGGMLWLTQPRGPGVPEAQRRWARRLGLLVAVDVLLFALLALGMATGALQGFSQRTAAAQGQAAPRGGLGVTLESAEGGVRLAQVTPGMPGEAAGLRPGDVVTACDTRPVAAPAELRTCVRGRAAGAPVALRLRRGAEEVEVTARPAHPLPSLRSGVAWDVVIALLLLGALALAGWVRARAVEPAAVALVVAALFLLPAALPAGLAARLPALVQVALPGLGMLLGAAWVRRVARSPAPRLRDAGADWPHALAPWGWAHVTVVARAGILAMLALALAGGAPPEALPVQTFLADGLRGPLAITLFVLAAAVLAPLAEELLFRGLLLEGLLRWLSPGWAVAASSAAFTLLHAGYGVRALPLFALACVLGLARLHTGALRVPVLLHAGQNLVASVVMLALRG